MRYHTVMLFCSGMYLIPPYTNHANTCLFFDLLLERKSTSLFTYFGDHYDILCESQDGVFVAQRRPISGPFAIIPETHPLFNCSELDIGIIPDLDTYEQYIAQSLDKYLNPLRK